MRLDGKSGRVNHCSNGHISIVYPGENCPLCYAINVIQKLISGPDKEPGLKFLIIIQGQEKGGTKNE